MNDLTLSRAIGAFLDAMRSSLDATDASARMFDRLNRAHGITIETQTPEQWSVEYADMPDDVTANSRRTLDGAFDCDVNCAAPDIVPTAAVAFLALAAIVTVLVTTWRKVKRRDVLFVG